MIRRILLLISAATLALFGGCIVSDQLATLTILPDGSADYVRLQSNIHSSEPGAKGAEELKRFVEEFDAHQDGDYQRLTQAGGKVLEARWLRREEPYANLLVAKLPSASALQEFCTTKGDNGQLIAEPRFTRMGKRRKLSILLRIPKDWKPAEPAKGGVQELRQEQASGISETRIAVGGGEILAAQGFTVAADRRSALLGQAEVSDLLQKGQEKLEIFLEWEVSGN